MHPGPQPTIFNIVSASAWKTAGYGETGIACASASHPPGSALLQQVMVSILAFPCLALTCKVCLL